jgi:uncharacterized protein
MAVAEPVLASLPVAVLASGHELRLHLWEISAGRPGPTLGLIGGVNGDQVTGVDTVRRVIHELAGSDLAGTVLALPVANPYAYQALSRHSPVDGNNLNRLFPGDKDGEFSAQLAFTIFDRVIRRCEYLIDFHSGGNDATVDYAYFYGDGSLARAFGTRLLLPGPVYHGALSQVADAAGINVMASELGGANQRNDYYAAQGVTGTINVLRSLDMLPGEPDPPSRQVTLGQYAIVRPHHGGILISNLSAARLGDTLTGGTLTGGTLTGGTELGHIVSPYTLERLEVLTVPYESSVLALTREPVTDVQAGVYAYILADASAVR